MPGAAFGYQVSHDFTDHAAELESVTGAGRNHDRFRRLRQPVNDEMLVRRVRENARGCFEQTPIGGRETGADAVAKNCFILFVHAAPNRVRIHRLGAMMVFPEIGRASWRERGWRWDVGG